MSLAALAASCGLTQMNETSSSGPTGGIWGGLPEEGPDASLTRICYVTALDYQKGYDWRSNQAKETVRCSLVVYADGRAIMKVPVGHAYEVGDDPDMHRILDGHLYTDYSTDSLTVIKKDGVTLFSYPARESVCGMYVRGGDVYTLGQNRSGEGFSYRKNGEVLISRNSGTVMGTLRHVGDSLSFAFYDTIRSADGGVDRYYAVNEGRIRQIAVRDDIRTVWDIVCQGEDVTYLASVVGVNAPVLFCGEQMTTVNIPDGAVLISSSLHSSSDRICVETLYRRGQDMLTSIFMNGVMLKTFGKGMTISSLCLLEDGVCCVVNPADAGSSGTIYRCGEIHSIPRGYSSMGPGTMAMVNGILHVGLSSTQDERPILWKDGHADTLKINGYISSVCVR